MLKDFYQREQISLISAKILLEKASMKVSQLEATCVLLPPLLASLRLSTSPKIVFMLLLQKTWSQPWSQFCYIKIFLIYTNGYGLAVAKPTELVTSKNESF